MASGFLRSILSSSSWGCELKYQDLLHCLQHQRHPLREDVSWNSSQPRPLRFSFVILFVRMWVEMDYIAGRKKVEYCHPLREDVSWNIVKAGLVIAAIGHPLREDVSWNINFLPQPQKCRVILIVRMWVEISVCWISGRSQPSSSSWGGELKLNRREPPW